MSELDRVMQRAVAELKLFLATLDRTKFIGDGRGGKVAGVVMPGSKTPQLVHQWEIDAVQYQAKATLWAMARHAASDPPSWTLPLPVDNTEVETLLRSSCPSMRLLGLFAHSSAMATYVPGHPSFRDFASGVMAHRACPRIIRDDAELAAQFPPRALRELSSKLVWREYVGRAAA